MFWLIFLALFGLVMLICLPIWIIQEITRDKEVTAKRRSQRWEP